MATIALDLRKESEFCAAQRTPYRADIDGLRAVAVLAVIGYHYFGPLFPGGYVGVDVFFVISGYLLSGIILSETAEGSFSFARFYERRIRRIFPALFALLAICTLFAGMFLLTPDLRAYLRSMLAAGWSASNFYFWKTSNYFDSPAADKPLLHTWSLAVEEQFYLLFPIFIFLLSRYIRRYLKPGVVVVALLSFSISVITVRGNQSAAFYLPMGRAWELLLG
ncbi:MAG: acyltransferase, partial [Bradyrhizobium sp.]|nr:acyltransferase [Bradyrhizobium sp.]